MLLYRIKNKHSRALRKQRKQRNKNKVTRTQTEPIKTFFFNAISNPFRNTTFFLSLIFLPIAHCAMYLTGYRVNIYFLTTNNDFYYNYHLYGSDALKTFVNTHTHKTYSSIA